MKEFPLIEKSWNKNTKITNIVYPNKYYGGVYCLAPLIIYNIVNQQNNFICDRVFLDKGKINSEFIGFTFQYEPDYYNFFKILISNNIDLNKEKRKQILFAGGPCVNTNYKPLAKYIDFFVLGEVEEILPDILEHYYDSKNKNEFLDKIKNINGVLIPGEKETYSFVKNLDNIPYPLFQPFPDNITKEFTFGKVFMLEIARGCPFRCHFCALSSLYKTVKIRSLKKIKEIIDLGIKINQRKKVIIYSPSFTHPKRKDILQYLIDKGLEFSIPSLRVDVVDRELLELIKKGGQKTLTIAPEANQRLRFTLNKKIIDEKYFNFIDLAKELNFKLKLYFMIGLPDQTKKDLNEMIDFINKTKCYVSINPFVPKPKTFLKDYKFDKNLIEKQIDYLRKKLKTRFKIANINNSHVEYKLSYSQGL